MSEKCPLCGADFSDKPSPADSVIAHMVSLADDDHEGIGYVEARGLVGAGVKPDPDDVEPTVERSKPERSVDNQVHADGGESGLGLDGPVERDGPDDRDDDGDDASTNDPPKTVDCPHCGTDTELTPDEHERGSLYRCQDCGGTYKWT